MRYVTRNAAFTSAQTWMLAGVTLRIDDGRGPPLTSPPAEVVAVRLEIAPTCGEGSCSRCRLALWSGQTLELFNRTCRRACDSADTGEATAPSWAAALFPGFIVPVAALVLIFNGLAWLILISIFPNTIRRLWRSKPRAGLAAAIPLAVVPSLPAA